MAIWRQDQADDDAKTNDDSTTLNRIECQMSDVR